MSGEHHVLVSQSRMKFLAYCGKIPLLVLATYHIRPLNQAFKSAIPSLSQLADSPEEEYN
jgi:hypothetical protein